MPKCNYCDNKAYAYLAGNDMLVAVCKACDPKLINRILGDYIKPFSKGPIGR